MSVLKYSEWDCAVPRTKKNHVPGVFLSLPEALTLPTWTKIADYILQIRVIKLFDFGLSFRREYLELRHKAFSKSIESNDRSSNTHLTSTNLNNSLHD